MKQLRPRCSSRARIAAVAVGLLVALTPSTAFADPAGPTDYRSEIVDVEPSTASIDIRVIGGDSFVQLVAEPGTQVVVVGYQGEENLWFRTDGTVWENQNSPSTYLNQERYGTDVPAGVSADAPPDWEQVGSGGSWAWHDHRAHWMQRTRPLAAEPGDQILEAVIPLVVDGTEVDVTVVSTWLDPPSRLPVWAAAATAIAIAVGVGGTRRRLRALGVAAVPLAVLALVIGGVQYLSLPSETEPSLVWWVLPAVAVVSSVAAVVLSRLGRWFEAAAAALLTGVELAVWAFDRRSGLNAAIVPTDLPGWIDRFGTALALIGGAGMAVAAGAILFGVLAPDRGAGPRVARGATGAAVSASTEPTG